MKPDDEFEVELDAEIARMDAEDAERKCTHQSENKSGSIIGDIIGTVIASAVGASL